MSDLIDTPETLEPQARWLWVRLQVCSFALVHPEVMLNSDPCQGWILRTIWRRKGPERKFRTPAQARTSPISELRSPRRVFRRSPII